MVTRALVCLGIISMPCTALVVRPVVSMRAPVAIMEVPPELPITLLASTKNVVAAVPQQQLALAAITGFEGIAATVAKLSNFVYLAPAAIGAAGMAFCYTLTRDASTVTTGLIAGTAVAAVLLAYNGARIANVLEAPRAQKEFVAFNLFGSFAMIVVNLQGLANLDS